MFPDTNFPLFFSIFLHNIFICHISHVSFSLLMGDRSAHVEGQIKDLFKFWNYKLLCKFMQ